jgi:hypothetical protein
MNTLICNTGQFHFDKASNHLIADLSDLRVARFPSEILMTSTHSGNTVRFVQDVEDAIKNEFWDGEFMTYLTRDPAGRGCRISLCND